MVGSDLTPSLLDFSSKKKKVLIGRMWKKPTESFNEILLTNLPSGTDLFKKQEVKHEALLDFVQVFFLIFFLGGIY